MSVHWYTSRVALAYEAEALIKDSNSEANVVVLEGRNRENCLRMDAVEAAVKNGIPVARVVCGGPTPLDDGQAPGPLAGPSQRCRSFDSCAYQARYNACAEADVIIMTHAHLPLEADPRVPDPEFNVVDESFFNELLDIQKIPRDEVAGHPVGRRLIEALTQDKLTLRKYLDYANITAPLVEVMLRSIFAERQAQIESLTLHTGAADLDKRLAAVPPLPGIVPVLKALLNELYLDRDDLRSFRIEGTGDEGATEFLIVRQRRKVKAFERPTLVLDATADPRILEIAFPADIEFHQIAVKRRGRITQVTNVLMNATALGSERGASYLMKAQRLIDGLHRGGHAGVIFTYRDITSKIRVPEGWQIDHFGNLRGTNKYQDVDTAVIIGRWQLPPTAIEDKVAALVHGTSMNPDMSGAVSKELRGYRLRDGSLTGKNVQVYQDPIWQAVNEQFREAELEQTLDRLRLIWAEEEKQVYVLTNLVGCFEVDELMTLDELAGWTKFDRAHDEIGPVVPMGAAWLSDNLPAIFGKLRACRDAVREESTRLDAERAKRVQKSLIDIHITNSAPFPIQSRSAATLIPYRVAGQRGSDTVAHVLAGTSLEIVEAELRRLHGKEVTLKLGANTTVLSSSATASQPRADDYRPQPLRKVI